MRLLRDLVTGTKESGRGLILTGDPGVGKSVLLQYARSVAAGDGLQVLALSGIQAESRLPFAGLQQLLNPLRQHSTGLPGPQRSALLTALGIASGPAPSVFLTGLATLNLLTGRAAEQPIVLALDDVNWLDEPTQTVIAFVVRRLGNDPLSCVATMRAGQQHHLVDVPAEVHEVLPLDDDLARRVLDLTATDLTSAERQAIRAAAQGNPLALVELPKAWRRERTPHATTAAATGAAVASSVPTTERLEASFAGRAQVLPRLTRELLLVAAVSDSESLPELLSAAQHLSGETVTATAAEAAADAGLVHYDDAQLRFRHPLVRAALIASASVGRRQEAARAWAASLEHEPRRRVRFQAAAATGPDEDLAQSLADVAAGYLRAGAVLDAVTALEQAAHLTPAPQTRGQRLLLAAEHAFGLGRADLVGRLVAEARRTPLSPLDRSRVTWLSEVFDDGDPRDHDRVEAMVLSSLQAAAAGDAALALNLLYAAAVRCWWSGAGASARRAVATALTGLGRDRDPQTVVALAVAEPLTAGAAVLEAVHSPASGSSGDADALRALGQAAWATGDSACCVDLLERAAALMRSQGRLGVLTHVLSIQANAQVTLGDWTGAEEAVAEATRLARETDQPIWEAGSRNVASMLAGLKGRPVVEDESAAAIEAYARARGLSDQLACLCLARAFAHAGQGHHAQACQQLLELFDPGSPYHHERESLHGLMLLAETAALVGRTAEARVVLERMEQLATTTPSPLLHVHLLYARPVLSADGDAEELFAAALAQDLSRWPWAHARIQLAYGVWLRRRRRLVESRAPLRAAADLLAVLGARHWAQRAQNELRASGERAEVVAPELGDLLSPQEMQIARLAATGLSNNEIGEQLFISARTVGSHLYHAFPKLQITSRSQLAARLGLLTGDPQSQ
jgi:DNA-binding CsgD family transcriptional regulator